MELIKQEKYTKQRAEKRVVSRKVVEYCEETNVPVMEVSWVQRMKK